MPEEGSLEQKVQQLYNLYDRICSIFPSTAYQRSLQIYRISKVIFNEILATDPHSFSRCHKFQRLSEFLRSGFQATFLTEGKFSPDSLYDVVFAIDNSEVMMAIKRSKVRLFYLSTCSECLDVVPLKELFKKANTMFKTAQKKEPLTLD